jgi:hypothetical protein
MTSPNHEGEQSASPPAQIEARSSEQQSSAVVSAGVLRQTVSEPATTNEQADVIPLPRAAQQDVEPGWSPPEILHDVEAAKSAVDALEPIVPQPFALPNPPAVRGRPFQKGQSGNPLGRPKGSRNRTTLAIEAMMEGEGEAIARKVIQQALAGDAASQRACLERIAPPSRERVVEFELRPIETAADAFGASQDVLDALTAGLITFTQAKEAMDLIDRHVRVLGEAVFEAKIAAAEKSAVASKKGGR